MTIAQQLKIKDFPFFIKDKNGKEIYNENSRGVWYKREYDSNDNLVYYEDFNGFWSKYVRDSNGNTIYHKDSSGYWFKREYDSNGNVIYEEDYDGVIYDNRPKQVVEVTLEDIANKMGIKVEQLRIKDLKGTLV
jgi:hypothetical protein